MKVRVMKDKSRGATRGKADSPRTKRMKRMWLVLWAEGERITIKVTFLLHQDLGPRMRRRMTKDIVRYRIQKK